MADLEDSTNRGAAPGAAPCLGEGACAQVRKRLGIKDPLVTLSYSQLEVFNQAQPWGLRRATSRGTKGPGLRPGATRQRERPLRAVIYDKMPVSM